MANEPAARPGCLNLRCKEMFYKDVSAAPSEHDRAMAEAFGSWENRAYWCHCTQTGRGPDEQAVNRDACSRRERSCFKGLEHLA